MTSAVSTLRNTRHLQKEWDLRRQISGVVECRELVDGEYILHGCGVRVRAQGFRLQVGV